MVIGADVTVGENTVIEKSVVGDGCRIGSGVTITDSYIWAGAEVGDGAKLEGAVVASRAMAKTPAGAVGARKKGGGEAFCWGGGKAGEGGIEGESGEGGVLISFLAVVILP